jgi:hypothetical protein
MGRPHELPMRHGPRFMGDPYVRWGSAAHITLDTAVAAPSAAPPNQLVKATLPHPQCWDVFLFVNLVSGVPAAGVITLSYAITLGNGIGQNTFHFGFVWNAVIAVPVIGFASIASSLQEMWTSLDVPAKDIQIGATLSEIGVPAAIIELDVGAYVAPRVTNTDSWRSTG